MILSFDTCCTACSVAISDRGKIIAYNQENTPHKQASLLLSMINDALTEARLTYQDIKLIAVTRGPGSFTGIRIGLAAAYGIHLARSVPLYGISTLEAIAQDAPEYPVLVALAAGRGQYYTQLFTARSPSTEGAALLSESEIESYRQTPIIGNYPHGLMQIMPDAKQIAAYIDTNFDTLQSQAELPQPLYIREHDAKPLAGS